MKETIKNNLDSKRFVSLIESLGDQLNSPKDRFDKSDIIEQGFDIYSNGLFKWVDAVGYDHVYGDIKLEFKYVKNGIFGKRGLKPFIKAKIKNSLGSNKDTISNPADYYIICDQRSLGVVSYETMEPYLVSVSDGIALNMPSDKLDIVYDLREYDISLIDCNYKERKAKMQKELIESIGK